MDSILEQLRTANLRFDRADYFQDSEYQALRQKEAALYEQLKEVMGQKFAEEYTSASNAVWSYPCASWFQSGARLGAQLLLAMLEPL